MVSHAMPSEGSKVMHIHLRFPALSYIVLRSQTWPDQTDGRSSAIGLWAWRLRLGLWISWIFSQVSERPKFFVILDWEMWFLIWHFSYEIWHKEMSHDPALLAKTEMLLSYPNLITSPITNSPATVNCFKTVIWILYNLFTFILPL